MYEDARDSGRNIYDKAADVKDDIAYKARRSINSAKDYTDGFTNKLGSVRGGGGAQCTRRKGGGDAHTQALEGIARRPMRCRPAAHEPSLY
jgi:hypothetical protein